MALTKAEIAQGLIASFKMNKRAAKQMVELLFEEIRQILEKGEEVKLSGFGNFTIRSKKERPGRNPKTGKYAPIGPRTVVTFKPGQKLRKEVEKYEGEAEREAS